MMTSNLRALRLALLATLAAGVLSFANTASAQWGDGVCGDPNTVQFVFSGFSFSGLDKCVSDCKQIGSLCKSLVKDAASCNQTSVKGYWVFMDNENCDTIVDPVSRKSCHQEIDGLISDSKDNINGQRAAALDSCAASMNSCILNCSAAL